MDKRCIILVIDRYNTQLVKVLHPNFVAMHTAIQRNCLALLITSGLLLSNPAWSQTEKNTADSNTGELPESAPLPPANQLDDNQAQAIFDAAMQERDSGEVFSAIEKFEYILSRRPSLNRARLELAVSYHRASQYDKALKEFQIVLDNPDTPEKVRLAILAYLGQLTSDELKPKTEHSFSYYTKVGALYNSNINYASLDGYTRLIGNQEIIIPDDQDQSSTGLETFLSASHRYRDNMPLDFGGVATLFEWQSQVSWTGDNYSRTSDFNINTLSASTGPALFATGRWRGALNFQVDQTWFGSSTLGTFLSVNPLLTFELGNYRGLTLEASYTSLDYDRPEDDGRDGDNLLLGAGYSALLGGTQNGIETGIRASDLSTDDPQYSYQSAEVYFGGFATVSGIRNSSLYLNLSFRQYDFDAPDTDISGEIRDEFESRYSLGYNYDYTEGLLKDWTLNASYTFSKNDSNVEAYSYEQHLFGVNLARYFL